MLSITVSQGIRGACFCVCIFALAGIGMSQEKADSNKPDHVLLKNDDVSIAISKPTSPDNYRGTRFDRSGIFHKISFRGHSLCERWHDGPLKPTANDDVTGPCEEFGNGMPLGYQPNQPGSVFLKIGVGKLKQPQEERYRFSFPYEVVEEGKWTVDANDNSVVFSQSLNHGEELGYDYQKTIALTKNGFDIQHRLKNTGKTAWTTDHYNHNFFLIDSDRVGPNYRIEFPFELKPTREAALFKELVHLNGRNMGFQRAIHPGESYFAELVGHSRKVTDHAFEIHHKPSRVVVTCRGDAPLHKLNVWGMKNTICPEPYVEISLLPNESKAWTLSYSFRVD
ncbi:MAG: hypothetical protein ABL921_29065 [Pirellula sp.]